MKNKGILHQILSLLLKDDPSLSDWLKEPTLHSSIYTLFVYSISYGLIGITVMFFPLSDVLSNTNNGVFWYRVLMSIYVLGALFILFTITFRYFKYTIEKGNLIKFDNVLFFYILSIILFGALYYFSFFSKPDLFQYDAERIIWTPIMGLRTFDAWSTKFYFILYSAFESTGGKFIYLQANSILISIINYIQTLYGFTLVSLLIAGYINQKTNKSA